jgi:hypothetical protein
MTGICPTSDATTQTKSNEEPADGEASGAPPPRPASGAADSEGATTGSSVVITNPIAATTQTTHQEEPADDAMDYPKSTQD